MKITLPKNFSELTEKDKDDFMGVWITTNKDNLKIVVEGNVVKAYDKVTGNLLASKVASKENLEYYKLLQDDYVPEDFNMRFTVKPGEPAYVLDPEMHEDGDPGDFQMEFKAENIKKVKVIAVSGANDLSRIVDYITLDGECSRSSIVQEAVFAFYTDALKALGKCDGKLFDNWEQYFETVKSHVVYRWLLDLPVKMGETAYILDRFRYEVITQADKDKLGLHEYKRTKFSRAIVDNLRGNTIDVETIGKPYYRDMGHLADIGADEEIVVRKEKETDHHWSAFYNNLRIDNLMGNYRVTMRQIKFKPI